MKKLAEIYNKFEIYALVLSLVITVVVIFIQVVARYVFNSSLTWSEEFSRYLFIWQTWLGASVAFKENKHIQIEILEAKLNNKGKIILNIIADIITLGFSIFLVINGSNLVAQLIARGTRSAGIGVPLAFIYASLPVSSFIICFRLLSSITKGFKSVIATGGEN
nr:TRAP transporter small permease [Sedimentibacter sp.]